MSERFIRRIARDLTLIQTYEEWQESCQTLLKALDDDPDVARLARNLSQLMRQYQDDLGTSEKSRYNIEEVGMRGYKTGVVSALRETIGLIADVFHVRLTETGWHWTQEEQPE